MENKTKIFRSILCGLLAFLISVSLVLINVLAVVRLTVFNPKYMISTVEKSGYAESLHGELKNSFISYGAACNVGEDFFDKAFEDIITVKRIEDDTISGITEFYNNNINTEASYEDIENSLTASLKTYASEKGYLFDKETNENIKTIAVELTEIYKGYAGMFKTSYFKTAASLLSRYMPVFNYAMIGLAVFALFAITVVCLSFKKPSNRLRFLIYATSSAFLMLLAGPAIVLIMDIGNKVNLADASLYGLVSMFINNVFYSLVFDAAVMAVITAVLHIIRIKLLSLDR